MAEAANLVVRKMDLRKAMIGRLIHTDAHFKHQQRGEPDLTPEEKSIIALAILEKSSVLFLERFSKFLSLEDVQYFQDKRRDYGVAFYIEEIERTCKDTKHNVVKNRRYQALQELIEGGEYFSEEEMKWRDPLLFDQMVGQYLDDSTKEEKEEAEIDKSDLRFSTILLKHMDTQASKQYYEVLKEREEEQLEESESDSSDEDDIEDDSNEQIREEPSDNETMMEIEINQMRGEFLRIMQERFLAGDDKDFDYSKVDSNTDYDSLDILGHDAEERYFDTEEDEEELDSANASHVDRNPQPAVGTEGHDPYENMTQRLAGVGLTNAPQTCETQEDSENMESQISTDNSGCSNPSMPQDVTS